MMFDLNITKILSDIARIIDLFDINQIPAPMLGVGGGIEARESIDIFEVLKFAVIFLAGISGVFGIWRTFAARKFAVETDPRVEQVLGVLAQAHCGTCIKVCPVNAASGENKKLHVIDRNKCIGCGICTSRCPVLAITGTINYPEVAQTAEAKKAARAKVREQEATAV